jgi:hypothetical protein
MRVKRIERGRCFVRPAQPFVDRGERVVDLAFAGIEDDGVERFGQGVRQTVASGQRTRAAVPGARCPRTDR